MKVFYFLLLSIICSVRNLKSLNKSKYSESNGYTDFSNTFRGMTKFVEDLFKDKGESKIDYVNSVNLLKIINFTAAYFKSGGDYPHVSHNLSKKADNRSDDDFVNPGLIEVTNKAGITSKVNKSANVSLDVGNSKDTVNLRGNGHTRKGNVEVRNNNVVDDDFMPLKLLEKSRVLPFQF